MYEPHLYPDAPVLSVFDKYFGEFHNRNYSQVRNIFNLKSFGLKYFWNPQICAVGWEPNSKHVEYLQQMSESYEACGHRVLINTRAGVGAHNAIAEVTDPLRSFQLE